MNKKELKELSNLIDQLVNLESHLDDFTNRTGNEHKLLLNSAKLDLHNVNKTMIRIKWAVSDE